MPRLFARVVLGGPAGAPELGEKWRGYAAAGLGASWAGFLGLASVARDGADFIPLVVVGAAVSVNGHGLHAI